MPVQSAGQVHFQQYQLYGARVGARQPNNFVDRHW
jgi:hypothetical protein